MTGGDAGRDGTGGRLARTLPAKLRGPLVIALLVLVAVIAAWQAPPLAPPANRARASSPERIMGTTCRLLAVPPRTASERQARAISTRALAEAEAALRAVEAEMSAFIDDSPLTRFNRAGAGKHPLPPSTLAVLRASAEAWRSTDGAFDVTRRPLLQLWKAAGKVGTAPSDEEIARARRQSSWSELHLDERDATKHSPGVQVDLGGIAKGWAIDAAVARMSAAGAVGGLVDVGGDLRVFGVVDASPRWQVRLRDPFGPGTIATLRMSPGAICTSGDYFRFVELDGRRRSHIVDPRTGQPAAGVRSATVVGPTASGADVWATALSVLGEPGLSRLPPSFEALLVLGERAAPRAVATRGFPALLAEALPYPLELIAR